MADELLRIQDMILSGKRSLAYQELRYVFSTHASNPDAWWLLSLVAPDRRMKDICVDTVRKMAPDHPGLVPTPQPIVDTTAARQPSRLVRSLRRLTRRGGRSDGAQR
jgi:hypothetical protein